MNQQNPDKQEKAGGIIRDEKGRYVKGISGNPRGRPKFSLVSILRELLQEIPEGEREIVGKRLMRKAIELASAGDTQMIRDLINRIDGLPKEKIEVEGEIEQKENNLLNLLKNADKETRKKVIENLIEVIRKGTKGSNL